MLRNFRRLFLTVVIFGGGIPFLHGQGTKTKSDLVYVDSVLAIVNSRVMTIYDVISESKFKEDSEIRGYSNTELQNPDVIEKLYSKAEKLREEIADRLLEEYLVEAEFKRKGYELPQAAVDDRIHRIAARVAKGDMERFRLQLKASGITMGEFRQRTQRKVSVEALLQQEVYDRIIVPPSEIEAYYKANQDSFVTKSRVRLQLLMISADSTEALKEKQAQVEKALKSGLSFSDAVKTYSIGPKKDQGGDLGWKVLSQQKQSVRDAIKRMEKGDTSEAIVEGPECFWIKLVDKDLGTRKNLDDVRELIRSILSKDLREKYYQDYIRRLMTRSYVRKYY